MSTVLAGTSASYARRMTDFPSALPASRIGDPQESRRLNWGILAPGGIAGNFADAAQRLANQRVVAVGSRSGERAAAFAGNFGIERSYDSYQALVADPAVQAVYVASPHSEHSAQARLAISAGKPVLVEKAFTRNAAEAREVLESARSAGVAVMEAMWTRFLPQLDVIRQLLADGVLGDIQTVIADHGQHFDIGPDHRLLDPALAGGALLDLGVYPVSFASFVLGRPDAITAVGELAATGVDAQVSALLQKSGAHALTTATLTARTPTTATISGTVARVEMTGPFYAPGPFSVTHRDGRALTFEPGALRGHEGMAYEAAHFAELVTSGAVDSPLLPGAETLEIMQTMDEIRRQVGVVYPDE